MGVAWENAGQFLIANAAQKHYKCTTTNCWHNCCCWCCWLSTYNSSLFQMDIANVNLLTIFSCISKKKKELLENYLKTWSKGILLQTATSKWFVMWSTQKQLNMLSLVSYKLGPQGENFSMFLRLKSNLLEYDFIIYLSFQGLMIFLVRFPSCAVT